MSDNSIFFKTAFAPNSFGFGMDGRTFGGEKDWFGFNGKACPLFWREKDNEVMVKGNWQDYGARLYDTRICRFPSPDPIIIQEHKYPELSPYQFASLNPILNIDLDGLEGIHSMTQFNNLQASGKVFIKVYNKVPEPVKRVGSGVFRVIGENGTCLGGVGIGIGSWGLVIPVGMVVFGIGATTVVSGVRQIANTLDGGFPENDPKYCNIVGEITQSETVDNLVGIGTSFAPTPNTFFKAVSLTGAADNTKNLVQIAAIKESAPQASPTSTTTNSTTSSGSASVISSSMKSASKMAVSTRSIGPVKNVKPYQSPTGVSSF